MTFLAPLGLLFLLAVPVVVLFYLLRVRFRVLEVSSTYLWERLVRDLAAQDPWQKPHFTLLMLFQILLLVLLALALARPVQLVLAQERVFAVLVLDASASMQANDVAPSRFAEARRLASQTIGQLPEGSTVAVILAKLRPEVAVAPTEDAGRALAMLADLKPGSTALDLGAALRLADALAAGQTKARVDVFTDGAFADAADVPRAAVPTEYHLVGGGGANQAVTAIAARPDPQSGRRYQVFARVRNFGTAAANLTLGIEADGMLVDSRSLTLPASASRDLVFDRLPEGATTIRARLLEADDLAVDDSAATVLARPQPTKVLLVSAGNPFLQRALALLPDVELYRVVPTRYGGIGEAQYDLIVFDGFLPESLPKQNLLLVNPPDSTLLPIEGKVERPAITFWESENPLLRYVSFADVRVQQASKVAVPAWAKALVSAAGVPLIVAGERDGQRILVLAFDLLQSNLPLSASFPILIANAVGYLEPPGVLQERTVAAGELTAIQPLVQADGITIEQPDGNVESLAAGKPVLYEADAVGVYTVRQTALGKQLSSERFAVNLADEGESDIQPRLEEGALPAPDAAEGESALLEREVWPWLVLASIVLLTWEWWWYHRRA